MRMIRSFDYISDDGFYAGPDEDLSWFTGERKENDEIQEFSHLNPAALNVLLFGRITYEMMRDYWSTAEAMNDDPRTTLLMRNSPKIVFSNSLTDAGEMSTWTNVTLMRSIDPLEIRRIQEESDRDMTILGSGAIVRQFVDMGLLDELQLTVVPKSVKNGKILLSQKEIENLVLANSMVYSNGFISRTYALHP